MIFSTWELQEDLEIVSKMTSDSSIFPGYSKENVEGFKFIMQEAKVLQQSALLHATIKFTQKTGRQKRLSLLHELFALDQ